MFLVLGLLLISATSVNAIAFPRWQTFPLNVYIKPDEKHPEYTAIVQKAYQTWASSTNVGLRFLYKYRPVDSNISQIRISFVDKLPQRTLFYEIQPNLSPLFYMGYDGSGFCYMTMGIKIRTLDADGNKIPQDKLYSIALQAAGRSLGVDCLESEDSVMSCETEFDVNKITKDDNAALIRVYKHQRRSEW